MVARKAKRNIEFVTSMLKTGHTIKEIALQCDSTTIQIYELLRYHKVKIRELNLTAVRREKKKLTKKESKFKNPIVKNKTFLICENTHDKLKNDILPEIKELSDKLKHLINNPKSFELLDLTYFKKLYKVRKKKTVCIVDFNKKLKQSINNIKFSEKVSLDFIIWFLIDSYYQK